MRIDQEVSLARYNTFGIDARADWLISYYSVDDLLTLVRDEYFQECRCLHIGEGSNVLFLANFHGIILRSEIRTLEIVSEDATEVVACVGSGMVWDDFVAWTVDKGYYGAENLSLIPGQVGASAIQNIGAYGTEVEQLIVAVDTVHRRSGQIRRFMHEDCRYAYRYSVFKETDMADYIVTHVHLKLSKAPKLNTEYAEVQRYLSAHGLTPELRTMREAIIAIRQVKLPDHRLLGNAGSFFMNPIVSAEQAERLRAQHPDLPTYPLSDGRVKLAAGWLIDRCGYKGYRQGNVGVYEHQALVLVNHGGATGQEVANLAIEIQGAVSDRFGVDIHPEVRYIS